MERSIATTFPRPADGQVGRRGPLGRLWLLFGRADAAHVGLFFVTLALGIYVFSDPSRSGSYNHFVWQADAFLHGRFVIDYPVTSGPFTNAYLQDVMPVASQPDSPSYGLLPFPPLPAVLLMPFVAIFGLATDSQLFGVVLGALNVGLAWRMTSRLTESRSAAFLATLFFAFGTVHWYASMLSTTWFLAHVVAVTFVLLGITLALDGERQEQVRRTLRLLREDDTERVPSSLVTTIEQSSLFLAWFRRARRHVDPLQFMAGFVFGIGALARLPVILGAPFFVFVGGGGSYWRRGFSAGTRRGDPCRAPAGLQPRIDGTPLQPGLRLALPHRVPRLHASRPPDRPLAGHRGSRPCPDQRTDHVPVAAVVTAQGIRLRCRAAEPHVPAARAQPDWHEPSPHQPGIPAGAPGCAHRLAPRGSCWARRLPRSRSRCST